VILREKHIAMIEIVAKGLKDLLDQVAFVGGATIILYLDEEEIAQTIRPTEDIDCVIEVVNYRDYSKLESKLRSLGFSNSTEKDAPICRWLYRGVQVDVMPTEGDTLGFSNPWYSDGLKNSKEINLPSGTKVKIFPTPYFLAAKTAAFLGRGKNNFYESRDLEDIVTVLAGCSSIRQDIYEAAPEIRKYLKNHYSKLLGNESFIQSITGHLTSYKNHELRAQNVLDVLKNI